jgi:hypothetical protein
LKSNNALTALHVCPVGHNPLVLYPLAGMVTQPVAATFVKSPFMKYLFSFLLTVSFGITAAQTPDTLRQQVLAATSSFLKLVENPKKEVYFFMNDLRETDDMGQPVYTAPYSLPGFTATVRKTYTDRQAGQTHWIWSSRFIEVPKGTRAAELDTLHKKVTGILTVFQNRVKAYTKDKAAYIAVSSNFTGAGQTDYLELRIEFIKAAYNTEQQAYDSLVNLYTPLLYQTQTATECTEKLKKAFHIERIPQEMTSRFFKTTIKSLAANNIDAAYKVLLAAPNDVMDVVRELDENQKAVINKKATQQVEDYYKSQRNSQQGETVATQQKKMEADKQLDKCEQLKKQPNAYKYKKGITVTGTVNFKGYMGILSSIDCVNGKIHVLIPGVIGKTASYIIAVGFADFVRWEKSYRQYHRCTRCGGEGGENRVHTETRVKELPFGYFEGITTTSTRTKTTTFWETCYKCSGTGYALDEDHDYWNRK